MKDQEIIQSTREGNTTKFHRCVACWHGLRFPHPDGQPIAYDNGFVPLERTFPHQEWCKNRGQF